MRVLLLLPGQETQHAALRPKLVDVALLVLVPRRLNLVGDDHALAVCADVDRAVDANAALRMVFTSSSKASRAFCSASSVLASSILRCAFLNFAGV
ncbi:MAG TPA: hypothetical protein VF658_21680 [Pyrinomonadaceae bacterium]